MGGSSSREAIPRAPPIIVAPKQPIGGSCGRPSDCKNNVCCNGVCTANPRGYRGFSNQICNDINRDKRAEEERIRKEEEKKRIRRAKLQTKKELSSYVAKAGMNDEKLETCQGARPEYNEYCKKLVEATGQTDEKTVCKNDLKCVWKDSLPPIDFNNSEDRLYHKSTRNNYKNLHGLVPFGSRGRRCWNDPDTNSIACDHWNMSNTEFDKFNFYRPQGKTLECIEIPKDEEGRDNIKYISAKIKNDKGIFSKKKGIYCYNNKNQTDSCKFYNTLDQCILERDNVIEKLNKEEKNIDSLADDGYGKIYTNKECDVGWCAGALKDLDKGYYNQKYSCLKIPNKKIPYELRKERTYDPKTGGLNKDLYVAARSPADYECRSKNDCPETWYYNGKKYSFCDNTEINCVPKRLTYKMKDCANMPKPIKDGSFNKFVDHTCGASDKNLHYKKKGDGDLATCRKLCELEGNCTGFELKNGKCFLTNQKLLEPVKVDNNELSKTKWMAHDYNEKEIETLKKTNRTNIKGITLYEKENFKGRQRKIGIGKHYFSELKLEKMVSSLVVKSNFIITLYTDNFSGMKKTFHEGKYDNLANWSDKASTALVAYIPKSKEKMICEFKPGRIYTGGKNFRYPGCGSSHCCKPEPKYLNCKSETDNIKNSWNKEWDEKQNKESVFFDKNTMFNISGVENLEKCKELCKNFGTENSDRKYFYITAKQSNGNICRLGIGHQTDKNNVYFATWYCSNKMDPHIARFYLKNKKLYANIGLSDKEFSFGKLSPKGNICPSDFPYLERHTEKNHGDVCRRSKNQRSDHRCPQGCMFVKSGQPWCANMWGHKKFNKTKSGPYSGVAKNHAKRNPHLVNNQSNANCRVKYSYGKFLAIFNGNDEEGPDIIFEENGDVEQRCRMYTMQGTIKLGLNISPNFASYEKQNRYSSLATWNHGDDKNWAMNLKKEYIEGKCKRINYVESDSKTKKSKCVIFKETNKKLCISKNDISQKCRQLKGELYKECNMNSNSLCLDTYPGACIIDKNQACPVGCLPEKETNKYDIKSNNGVVTSINLKDLHEKYKKANIDGSDESIKLYLQKKEICPPVNTCFVKDEFYKDMSNCNLEPYKERKIKTSIDEAKSLCNSLQDCKGIMKNSQGYELSVGKTPYPSGSATISWLRSDNGVGCFAKNELQCVRDDKCRISKKRMNWCPKITSLNADKSFTGTDKDKISCGNEHQCLSLVERSLKEGRNKRQNPLFSPGKIDEKDSAALAWVPGNDQKYTEEHALLHIANGGLGTSWLDKDTSKYITGPNLAAICPVGACYNTKTKICDRPLLYENKSDCKKVCEREGTDGICMENKYRDILYCGSENKKDCVWFNSKDECEKNKDNIELKDFKKKMQLELFTGSFKNNYSTIEGFQNMQESDVKDSWIKHAVNELKPGGESPELSSLKSFKKNLLFTLNKLETKKTSQKPGWCEPKTDRYLSNIDKMKCKSIHLQRTCEYNNKCDWLNKKSSGWCDLNVQNRNSGNFSNEDRNNCRTRHNKKQCLENLNCKWDIYDKYSNKPFKDFNNNNRKGLEINNKKIKSNTTTKSVKNNKNTNLSEGMDKYGLPILS